MEDDAYTVELPLSPESVSAARRFVRQQCQQWQVRDGYERILLLVSETVTNAVVHARSQLVRVRLSLRRPAVRVEVHDDDGASPVPHPPSDDAESGRGLHLVEALADTWGVTAHPEGGKTVWFDVTPTPEGPPE